MALPNLDPRTGGTCSKCMANKIVAFIMGYVNLMLWVSTLLVLMFDSSASDRVAKDSGTSSSAVRATSVFITLICIGFAVLLVYGLHKGRKNFVMSYCIFQGCLLVLFTFSLITKIFVQPHALGVDGFFICLLYILIHLLFFMVIRCYYLLAFCKTPANRAAF